MWDEGFSNEYIEIFKDNSKPYTTIKEFWLDLELIKKSIMMMDLLLKFF